jgi:flagellar hook assembly protein FlgD
MIIIKVYNSAGEVVRTVAKSPAYGLMVKGIFTISGDPQKSILGYGDTLQIALPGVSSTQGGADDVFTWDGKNDGEQTVSSGAYYVAVEQVDPYGHITTLTRDVTVMITESIVWLNIYNSAGELVRTITAFNRIDPEKIRLAISANATEMAVPSVIVIRKDNMVPVVINYGDGLTDNLTWDGKNSFGRAVDSGVYELQVVVKTEMGMAIVAEKSVTVLEETGSMISALKAVPNPYHGKGKGISFQWGAVQDGNITVLIMNMAGEHMKTLKAKVIDGSVFWDLTTDSGAPVPTGLYVVEFEVLSSDGHSEVKSMKIAIAGYGTPLK